MSNLSDLTGAIKSVNTENSSIIGLIGAFVGPIADFAGAAGPVESLLNILTGGFLFGVNDPTPAKLDEILNTIETEFQKLNLNTQGEDLKSQVASINDYAVNKAEASLKI